MLMRAGLLNTEPVDSSTPGGSQRGGPTPLRPLDPLAPDADPQGVEMRRDALRVLVVDDNVDACEGTAMLVDFAGYIVELAFDGPIAIEKAERFRPHVVLLDIAMPRMNGYEVAQRLRANPLTRDTLLIALTGLGAADDIARAWQAGFDDYRLKPVDIDELLDLLASRLNERRRR
ncbi:response regulator [Pararobbsia alpina]|uniref:Sensor histidine kinase RcsC n=1 Tax=Pararobbsia alpina TaxID=621374 RepID=A0A6S7BU66_9BURK|nr:response regulator [Pararobbsia alpina]CAB3799469.1 Sensor histidine kinase RcsC [Pararobbsia alpina]